MATKRGGKKRWHGNLRGIVETAKGGNGQVAKGGKRESAVCGDEGRGRLIAGGKRADVTETQSCGSTARASASNTKKERRELPPG